MSRTALVSKPLSVAICLLLSSPAALAQQTQTPPAQQTPTQLDTVVVTGTRLSRAEKETAMPLTVYTSEQIQATGKTTVAEVLRTLPYNTQGSSTPTPGSTGQSVTDINLRGLGFGRTLLLVNGHRVPADSTFFGFTSSTSFIPMGAVERIEVLRDGASSVYGSDALAGVVNIVLKDSIDGTDFWARWARPERGGDERVIGASLGGKSERVGGMLSVEGRNIGAASRAGNPVFGSDRSTLGFGFISNSYTPTWRSTDLLGNGTAQPGLWQASAGCPAELVRTSAAGRECRNPTADKSDFMPAFKVNSLFATGHWTLTDTLRARLELLGVNQNSSDTSPAVTRSANLSATNPFNPTRGASAANPIGGASTATSVNVLYALPDAYARHLDTRSRQRHWFGAVDWDIGPGTLTLGYLDASQSADSLYRNAVYGSALNAAIAAGTFNLFDAANPQRYEPFLRTGERHTESRLSSTHLDWKASLPFELGGGAIRYGLGMERRRERLDESCDALSGMFALSGAFCYAHGTSRSARASYVEVALPFTAALDVNYAGRHERYDIPRAGKYSQRLAANYRFSPQWAMRASLSEGMRAPNLFEIDSSSGELDIALVDAKRCAQAGGNATDPRCQPVLVRQYLKGGPDLRPETSATASVGLVWAPDARFNLAADWYRIKLDDQIQNLDSDTVLSLEAQGINLAQYGVSVTRNADGSLATVTSGSTNTPGFSTSGIDLEANLKVDAVAGGALHSRWVLSWIRDYVRAAAPGAPRFNAVGYINQPQTLFAWTNLWRRGAWSVGANLNRVAGFDARSPEDEFVLGIGSDVGSIAPYTTMDFSLGWQAPWNGEFTLGVRNAFGKTPSINRYAYGDLGYSAALSDMQGRVVGLSYRQSLQW